MYDARWVGHHAHSIAPANDTGTLNNVFFLELLGVCETGELRCVGLVHGAV